MKRLPETNRNNELFATTSRTKVGIPFRVRGPFTRQNNWVRTRGKRDADHIISPVYKDNNFPRVKDVGLRTKFRWLRLQYIFWGPGLFFNETMVLRKLLLQTITYRALRIKILLWTRVVIVVFSLSALGTYEKKKRGLYLKKHDTHSLHGQTFGVRTPLLMGPYRMFLLRKWA